MPTPSIANADTSTRVEVYIWAKTWTSALGMLQLPRSQAARYSSVVAALAAKGRGDDGFPGETLYSITVKELNA